jgi:hypothetical protein
MVYIHSQNNSDQNDTSPGSPKSSSHLGDSRNPSALLERDLRQTTVLVKNSPKNSSPLLAFDPNCVLNITYASKIAQTTQRLTSELSQECCEVPRRILGGSRIEGVRGFRGCKLCRGPCGDLTEFRIIHGFIRLSTSVLLGVGASSLSHGCPGDIAHAFIPLFQRMRSE